MKRDKKKYNPESPHPRNSVLSASGLNSRSEIDTWPHKIRRHRFSFSTPATHSCPMPAPQLPAAPARSPAIQNFCFFPTNPTIIFPLRRAHPDSRPHRHWRIHKPPLAQPRLMHQPAHMVRVITDSDQPLDSLRQPAARPAVAGKSVCPCAVNVHPADRIHLIGCQTAGTSRGAPSAQRLHTLDNDGSLPA